MKTSIKSTIFSFLQFLLLYFVIIIINSVAITIFRLASSIYYLKTDTLYTNETTSSLSVENMIISTLTIFTILFVWKYIKKKPFSKIGLSSLKSNLRNLIIGLFVGFISITLCFIGIYFFGNINVTLSETLMLKEYIFNLMFFILIGFSEEILIRGYLMSSLSLDAKLNKYIIIFISSLVFAAMHLSNNSINVLSFINIVIVGILYGYMYISTGSIWMCIGSHITWNYFQGVCYGFNVSGNPLNSILNVSLNENNIINGGGFGIEGSLFCTIILLLQIFFIKKSDFIKKKV